MQDNTAIVALPISFIARPTSVPWSTVMGAVLDPIQKHIRRIYVETVRFRLGLLAIKGVTAFVVLSSAHLLSAQH